MVGSKCFRRFICKARTRETWSYTTCLPMIIYTRFPSWANVILFTTIFLVSYSVFGRYRLYRDPNGIFFDAKRAYQRRYSLQREDEAIEFLKNARHHAKDRSGRGQQARDQNMELCASIITFGARQTIGKRHPLEVYSSVLDSYRVPY
jgi:hypothetical protein